MHCVYIYTYMNEIYSIGTNSMTTIVLNLSFQWFYKLKVLPSGQSVFISLFLDV